MEPRTKRTVVDLVLVIVISTLLIGFFYWHESFPKPLRAITALFGVPTAVASGLSHYLNLGIPVYDTPWAVILANVITAVCLVAVARKFLSYRRTQ